MPKGEAGLLEVAATHDSRLRSGSRDLLPLSLSRSLGRKQNGFLDQLTILSESGEIIYIYTFWKDSEDAEKYDCTTLPALTTLLTGVIDGAPHVHAFGGLRGRLSRG